MPAADAHRAQSNPGGESDDASKITVTIFILRAAVLAAPSAEPQVNAPSHDDAIARYGEINLGVAVALDEGLVTPSLGRRKTNRSATSAAAVKDLAHRAQQAA